MKYVVFKYSNATALKNRLSALGLAYKEGNDESGNPYRTEEFLGSVSTPHLEDTSGDFYFATYLPDADADKIPNNDQNPAFTIIWRDDETDENGDLLPWPEVTVQAYDIDGNPSGTRQQSVGRIQ